MYGEQSAASCITRRTPPAILKVKNMTKPSLLLAVLLLCGCTSEASEVPEIEEIHSVKCYSGGQLIYEGTHKNVTVGNPGTAYMRDDGKYWQVVVSANCIVKRI